jgi:hypothetical protein
MNAHPSLYLRLEMAFDPKSLNSYLASFESFLDASSLTPATTMQYSGNFSLKSLTNLAEASALPKVSYDALKTTL